MLPMARVASANTVVIFIINCKDSSLTFELLITDHDNHGMGKLPANSSIGNKHMNRHIQNNVTKQVNPGMKSSVGMSLEWNAIRLTPFVHAVGFVGSVPRLKSWVQG